MILPFVSAFSGILGFEVGFPESMVPTCYIENDKHARKVITEHSPDVPLLGDINDVTAPEIGRPELAVAGFPCQDTSIAAPHRRGLAGTRSRHYYSFIRLLEEYQRLIDATNPRWVVIENPDGLLKSRDGRDMAAVVMGLEDLGYGWAFRVVDAGRLGTIQRRKRLLVVGHRGGDPRPAGQVLGLIGPRSEAAGEGDSGRQGTGPGPTPVTVGGDLVRVWRKKVRSQVALRLPDGTFNPKYRETWVNDGVANTLNGFDGGAPTRQTHLIAQHGRLRSPTYTEWERLQGFPDDWTAMLPESARAKVIGNAIHTGTARWLGEGLVSVHDSLPQLRSA